MIRSDIVVKLEEAWGSDRKVARMAWVTPPDQEDEGTDGHKRVIRALLRKRVKHTSPFEHSGMTVYVDAPAVVWWEWTRHRFMSEFREDHSFSLESGRYRILRNEFYVPPYERPLREPEDFKPMRPTHESDEELTDMVADLHEVHHEASWEAYQAQLKAGVAREVARLVLGPAIYYAGYVSANLLTWLHFLSLRTKDDPVKPQSFPQWEIEMAAIQCEDFVRNKFPIAYDAFCEFGRVI